jgi:hypothetical protein
LPDEGLPGRGKKTPHPNPLPEYRERGKYDAGANDYATAVEIVPRA